MQGRIERLTVRPTKYRPNNTGSTEGGDGGNNTDRMHGQQPGKQPGRDVP